MDVRIPLASGATAWKARVAIAARLVPGALLLAYLVWLVYAVMMAHGRGAGFGASMPVWAAVLLLLFGGAVAIVMILSSFALLRVARGAAPADLIVTTDGFRVRGGPNDGVAGSWRDVTSVAIDRRAAPQLEGAGGVVRAIAGAKQKAPPQIAELKVGLASGTRTLALSLDDAEGRALEAVAAVIAAARGDAPPAEPALGKAALACASCGSAVAPEDSEHVACAKCHAEVAVPAAVREKVRAAYALPRLRATGQSALARMLETPSASATSTLVWILGAAAMLIWPIAIAGAWRLRLDELGWLCAIAGTAAAVALVDAIVRPRLIARQALPITVIDYGARAPAFAGGPLRCRTCEAALPSRFDGRVARCAACASDNVLGLDLSRELPLLRAQARALDDDLAIWTARRAGALVTAAIAAVALVGLFLVAARRVRHDPLDSAVARACEGGDVRQCSQYAMQLRNDHHGDRARAVLDRACDPSSADAAVVSACVDLGLMLGDTLDPDASFARDPARAEALLRSGCTHGNHTACEAHTTLCTGAKPPPGC